MQMDTYVHRNGWLTVKIHCVTGPRSKLAVSFIQTKFGGWGISMIVAATQRFVANYAYVARW